MTSQHSTAQSSTAQGSTSPSFAKAAQTITPELRSWIVQQAQQGFAADVVLKSMMTSGWTEDVAIAALETTLSDHLHTTHAAATLPPSVPVPVIALQDSPMRIDVDGHSVHLLSRISNPDVVVFGNVLTADECDALIAAAKPRLNRSLTVATKTGGEELNADRTSSGMFFRRDENSVVQTLERRLAALVNWPVENGEGLQILHYRPGAEYKPHYDYFDPDEPGTPTILKRGGQRVATIIMYLNEPERGGHTIFPDLNFEVTPQRGNAVFFSYNRAHPSSKSLHGGAPVIAGEKWIATKWLRERRFE
jgi:prolyl 4-hydroxylase